MSEPVALDGTGLTLERFLEVVRGGRPVALAAAARERMRTSRAVVEAAVARGEAVYGVTTGFGALSTVPIPPDGVRELQTSLVRSHASGTGPPLAPEVVRGLLLCRANSLARGMSGIRPELVDLLLAFLDRGLTPWIPEQGSVGASGDLAPLAHLALAAMGEGTFAEGSPPAPVPAAAVLAREGLRPAALEAKEGVALLNGTALMAAYLALGVADARRLLEAGTVAAALAVEALLGTPEAFDDRLGEARNAPDERRVASALRALLDGSELAVRRTEWSGQDPYTIRCLPQVLGAVETALGFAGGLAGRELNAVTDNPLVFGPGEFVSGGNFHGQPLAFGLDALALAVQYVAGFSERRVSRLLHPALNRGLPAFLAPKPGISSGLMVPQYVAASLVNESATLVHPASATSLPTSADQEDYVSMGAWAGAKLRRVLENARKVVAIEWIVAGQALELRRPRHGGRGSEAALRALRVRVRPWTDDRSLTPDLERVAAAIASGELVAEVRRDVAF